MSRERAGTRHMSESRYLDAEEKALIEAFEAADAPLKSGLTQKRKHEIEAMARATMANERAEISLRIPKRDLVRLKSRALQQEISYQTLINALTHQDVSD